MNGRRILRPPASGFRLLAFVFCILHSAFCLHLDAQPAPDLSITLFAPGFAEISWPSNYSGWQLTSATNLGPVSSWQNVLDTPLPLGNALVVFEPLTNNSRYFRLQSSGGGGTGGENCTFQATPQTIPAGGSSTLSWQTVAGTSYSLAPGPGPIAGSNYVVSPTATTIYTLASSNLAGLTFCYATVAVVSASCPFLTATSWDCTLTFSYVTNVSSPNFIFSINETSSLSFHLTLVAPPNNNLAIFSSDMGGLAQINDSELMVGSPPPITVIGSGPPLSGQPARLTIDCGKGVYSFDLITLIDASWNGIVMQSKAGEIYVNNRALPATYGALASDELLPVRGPFWSGTGDWYAPGDLGFQMFFDGLVTDTTAGSAHVTWSFSPSP